ncbi:MAG: TorF family putative porin, partial [Pontixanthobacter sp.]
MLTSNRGPIAACLSLFVATTAAPAIAQEEPPEPMGPVTVSGSVTLASEYRFRGIDQSGGEFAIQGSVDAAHESGFYVGAWASSLDEDTVGFGSTELDIYGGWSGDVAEGLTANVGALAYIYPDAGAGDFDYYEGYGSLTFAIGPAEATGGIAYAPKQDGLGGNDNLYLYTDVGFGIPDTPVTITGHIGYTDGALTFTDDGDAFDWSIGAEAAIAGTPLTISA